MGQDVKHTPGPWHRDAQSGARCDVRAANGRKVALCWGLSTSKGAQTNSAAYRAECDANAHLIAAAPDLLEALKARREACEFAASISEAHADGTGLLPKHVMDTADLLFTKAERLEIAAIAKGRRAFRSCRCSRPFRSRLHRRA